MRATHTGDGLVITLTLKDKEEAGKTNKLTCRLNEYKKPYLTLHILDEVGEELRKRGGLENPGFHIDAFPRDVAPERVERYDVYLSKERFKALTNPEEDPVVEGGHFTSRSLRDNVNFNYWGL